MANIKGVANALPGPYSTVKTLSSGVATPGGSRVAAMIGQGTTNETLVSQAQGGGLDGLNSTFTSSSGTDGRHFSLSNFPLIANRTTIFKNGLPLVGLELGPITSGTKFSGVYDYQLDPTTGHLLLQSAHLKDQGGTFYTPLSSNVGLGQLNTLTLVDLNSPPEIWTVRCVSVQRTALNVPIPATAKFLAFGSISGAKLDSNGNPVVWIANGNVVTNGVISFSITETAPSTFPFRQGDGFTVIVQSGVLVRGDSLTSNEIPKSNINNPTLTQGLGDVVAFSGQPSTTNNLSLGGQLFYANAASSMIAVQAAPALPRRTSFVMSPSVNANSTNDDDFIFPFPLGVVPDLNSDVHVFVANLATQVESQVLPNKVPFYSLASGQSVDGYIWPAAVHNFIVSDLQPPAGDAFCYSVVNGYDAVISGNDGILARFSNAQPQTATFATTSSFDSSYVGKLLKVIDTKNTSNQGVFNITAVSDGLLTVSTVTVAGEPGEPNPLNAINGFPDFVSKTGVSFEVINVATGLQVDGYSGTDGILVANLHLATATLNSSSVDFSDLDPSIGTDGYYRLQINDVTINSDSSVTYHLPNNGLFDITDHTGSNELTLGMAFVDESSLRYEILDPLQVSTYLVLNKNVVPNGNQLRVTLVDARDAGFYDAGWVNALASLEMVECDIVVPLPNQTISVIFQNTVSHCIAMSNTLNRKERVMFAGAINGLTPANLTGTKLAAVEDIGVLEGIQGSSPTDVLAGNIEDLANYSVADAFGSTYRAVYFYPDQIVVQAGTSNVLIDGFYIAAAAAGHANQDLDLSNPFTNKVLSGFTILANRSYSNLVMQQLAAAGVTTLVPVAGGGRVIWGITTSQSGFPEEQEISIVFIRDRVAKVLRSSFAGFIGTPQTDNTGLALNTEAVLVLNSLITQGLITRFRGLSVAQDQLDPRQWNISVDVAPTYPINWIYIQVSVGNIGA